MLLEDWASTFFVTVGFTVFGGMRVVGGVIGSLIGITSSIIKNIRKD